jgi:hypothetical protein
MVGGGGPPSLRVATQGQVRKARSGIPDQPQTMDFMSRLEDVPETSAFDNGFKWQWRAFLAPRARKTVRGPIALERKGVSSQSSVTELERAAAGSYVPANWHPDGGRHPMTPIASPIDRADLPLPGGGYGRDPPRRTALHRRPCRRAGRGPPTRPPMWCPTPGRHRSCSTSPRRLDRITRGSAEHHLSLALWCRRSHAITAQRRQWP